MKYKKLGILLISIAALITILLRVFWLQSDGAFQQKVPLGYVISYDSIALLGIVFALPVIRSWGGSKSVFGKVLSLLVISMLFQIFAYSFHQVVGGGPLSYGFVSQALYAVTFISWGISGVLFFQIMSPSSAFYKAWFAFVCVGASVGVGAFILSALIEDPRLSRSAYNVAFLLTGVIPAIEAIFSLYFARRISHSHIFAPIMIFTLAMMSNSVGNFLSVLREPSEFLTFRSYEEVFYILCRGLLAMTPLFMITDETE